MMGPMNFSQAVVAGEGAAREGRSVWWQRIHLGAALNMTALTGAALIVRGGNRGAGGHFNIVDAPSQWDMDTVTCSSAPAAWQDAYTRATRYSGAHAYAWHVVDVAAALRAQYLLTGQLNLALEPAGGGDGPLVWSTRSSAHPPLLVLDWA
eukprot:TRINITY_DN7889_c0_g2_i1.p3 TRINITY_DN7889_c0_g2~~TRINITY_DN7889_c0_g2_i1.p3  ORF type:complete len:151 (-),score=53.68 TRINITY_DN7889_c0_g2_i1:276-728(-)